MDTLKQILDTESIFLLFLELCLGDPYYTRLTCLLEFRFLILRSILKKLSRTVIHLLLNKGHSTYILGNKAHLTIVTRNGKIVWKHEPP